MATKQQVLDALRAFVRQRPGLEFGNYGDVRSYRAEMRQITRDRHHAEALISAVAWRDSITAEKIIEAAKHAYSGRLDILVGPTEGERLDGIRADQLPTVRIDYCTGQYFPTEYRRAVCAVMAACLWDYWRDAAQAKPDEREYGSLGNEIRATARAELGRTIAQRWFN